MLIRNGQAVGGALSEQELTKVTENCGRWKQIPRLAQGLTTPARLFETLGAWRTGKVDSDAAANFVEGKMLRRTYVDYGQNQIS